MAWLPLQSDILAPLEWGGPITRAIGGTTIGIERPILLLLVPIGVGLLWYFIRPHILPRFRGGNGVSRGRRLLFLSRVVIVTLVVIAAMGPYTIAVREATSDPEVTLLVDRSNSMAVQPNVSDRLASEIEAQGVPVTTTTIATTNASPIGDGIVANLRENGSVVVVSDGQVTEGTALTVASEVATELNATVSAIDQSPNGTERAVSIDGPSTVSRGVTTRFVVTVSGVGAETDVPVTVTADGREIAEESIASGRFEVAHTFNETGPHRIDARIDTDDRFGANNVYHKSVEAVEQPEILYVSRGDYPLESYLSSLYDLERAEAVPSGNDALDPYYAVVLQDVAAQDIGDTAALQEFVIDGNGLFVVGGPNAYELGEYDTSTIASMLPVQLGEGGQGQARIVIAIDVSGSVEQSLATQKALALDVLNQLGDQNTVGVVAFDSNAYRVADLQDLSTNRQAIEDKILRLQTGRGTEIEVGLEGAADLLGGRRGSIILISDGGDDPAAPAVVADQLRRDGIRVIPVGVGNVHEDTLRQIAENSGGSFLLADETSRLRLLFGGATRQYNGTGLTVVSDHFITAGLELTAVPDNVNEVAVKPGAEYLVATGEGDPAVASWRYGLGRVVSLTTYDGDGTLGDLLEAPDSLLVTKATNWAIGDPRRKQSGVTSVADTRLLESTVVLYRGEDPPDSSLQFTPIGDDRYRATVTPDTIGYHRVLGTEYAANYPRELSAFGRTDAMGETVRATGGKFFGPRQAADIAGFARQQATRVQAIKTDWTWAILLLGILIFIVEVLARRVQVYRGQTRSEAGFG